MPVSVTLKHSVTLLSPAASTLTANSTLPCSVNLMALDSRLVRIWFRRVASPCSVTGSSSGRLSFSTMPLASAVTAMTSMTCCSICCGLNGALSSFSSPASIFDRSSTSLMTASSALLATLILATKDDCSSFSPVCPSRYDSPMTTFIGVRISWLMFARKSLLAQFACSALRVASRSEIS